MKITVKNIYPDTKQESRGTAHIEVELDRFKIEIKNILYGKHGKKGNMKVILPYRSYEKEDGKMELVPTFTFSNRVIHKNFKKALLEAIKEELLKK